ncbi:MAG: hypothetical protein K5644_09245 [Lachnospiraceae bacterium]|nr:hypothetical protein [Lachnospiraceae bacterium]
MKDIQEKIEVLNEYKEQLSSVKDDLVGAKKAKKSGKGFFGVLLIILAVVVGLFALTFVVYMFNLDMKLMAAMEPIFLKHYDKVERDEHL